MVWQRGVLPQMTTRQLEVLRDALVSDDNRLLQGATTSPPPLLCVQDWPCEGGCLIAFPYAFEDGDSPEPRASWAEGVAVLASPKTVGEVEQHFAEVCWAADQAIGEPAVIRELINWFDETPREVMRRELLTEVTAGLAARKECA